MEIEQAQRDIAQILSKLESATGQLVRSISCHAIEVTGLMDTSPVHQMQVVIELERLPGHQW